MVGKINIVALEDVNDTDVERGLASVSWDLMTDMFKSHDIRESKEGPCLIPANFKPKDQWKLSDNEKPSYRIDENIESITVAILDLDTRGSKELAEEYFGEYEHIIYSTHSYTKEQDYKFRIVIKLDEPISGKDWPELFRSLVAPIEADRSCGNLSRVFYFPSHSPHAGIKPYFHHNEGRALTKGDFIAIRKKYESKLNPDQLKEYRDSISLSTGSSAVSSREHFSGEKLSPVSANHSEIDWSYEGQIERYGRYIPILIDDDNRHEFSLRVCSSAVGSFREKTDFFNLIQFMYKASTHYGSKPIIDPSGDTRREIPEHISSAVSKFAPELALKIKDSGTDVRSYIRSIIEQVEVLAVSESWKFPSEITRYSQNGVIEDSILKNLYGEADFSYEGIRNRNLDILKSYVRSGDFIAMVKSVYLRETDMFKEQVNFNALGQFAYSCGDSYMMNYKKMDNVALKHNENLNNILGLFDHDPGLFLGDVKNDSKMVNFAKTSMKIGRHAAKTKNWNFPAKPDNENENTL